MTNISGPVVSPTPSDRARHLTWPRKNWLGQHNLRTDGQRGFARARAVAMAMDAKLALGQQDSKVNMQAVTYRLRIREKDFFLKVSVAVGEAGRQRWATERRNAEWAGQQRYAPNVLLLPPGFADMLACDWLAQPALPAQSITTPTVLTALMVQLRALHRELAPSFFTHTSKFPKEASNTAGSWRGPFSQIPLTAKDVAQKTKRLTLLLRPQDRPTLVRHGDFWPSNVHPRGHARYAGPSQDEPPLAFACGQPGKFYFVDWDKAGVGDPFEDIGVMAAHALLSDTQVRDALEAYVGRQVQRYHVDQVRLYMASVYLNTIVWFTNTGDMSLAATHARRLRDLEDLFTPTFRYRNLLRRHFAAKPMIAHERLASRKA